MVDNLFLCVVALSSRNFSLNLPRRRITGNAEERPVNVTTTLRVIRRGRIKPSSPFLFTIVAEVISKNFA